MFTRHVTEHLSAYDHGELSTDERLLVESHLRECAKCRADYDEVHFGVGLASQLSLSSAPDSLWNEIHSATTNRQQRFPIPLALAAASIVAALLVGVFLNGYISNRPSWEVTAVRGSARIGNAELKSAGRLREGQALQTGDGSEADVNIANIGHLTLDPNTKIRLLVTRSEEHRIALDRGKVEARTSAPPRLFIVDTPSATAVDLGCAYTLEVQDDGSSVLHVTLGLVALQHKNREIIVPAGASSWTRKGTRQFPATDWPGTPVFEDASRTFKKTLGVIDAFQEGPGRTHMLEDLLRESRIRDGLTLWYLIPRLDPQSRGLIYDRLAQLLPPPPEVTRDGIITLNPQMLDAWKQVVSQLWQ
jgi:hypothetical protein